MPIRRLVTVAAIAALAMSALTGCVGATPVATKTDAIRQQLVKLPGVVDSSTKLNEHTVLSEPHSVIELTVEPGATAAQVERIVTTFAHANVATGLDVLSSELHLVAGKDTLQLLNPVVTDAQATALADEWVKLRGTYATTALGMVIGSGADYVVNLAVRLKTTGTEDALIDIHNVAAAFTAVGGHVGRYEQVDGRFAASDGLPGDDLLNLVDGINRVLAADGTEPDLHGEFNGLGGSFTLLATVADSTDAVTGLNAAAVRLLNALGPATSGLRVQFLSATDKHAIATFDDRSCDSYRDDASRRLLAYWTRDGRTLLDGSTAASCAG